MKFRKKPVVIEAVCFDSALLDGAMPDWFAEASDAGNVEYAVEGGKDVLFISTLEGCMKADFGDWIIRGVKGELYPCKPDIFAATYEVAE